MLELHQVSKTYTRGFIPKKVVALRQLSLRIQPGEVYAFLGPNGAGKTTTIKAILGIVSVDSGEIRINGIDHHDKKVRRLIGYLPDQPYFYDDLNTIEYLRFSGRLYGLSAREINSRINDLIPMVGLSGKEKLRLRSLSRGLLQRLGMAQALIHDPQYLILDEPMTGLDPIGRKELRDLILSLKQQGKTIFFSSHILADAEMISDRVGILHKGRLVREMALHELQAENLGGMEVTFHLPSGWDNSGDTHPWPVELFDHSGMIHLQDAGHVFDAVRWVEELAGTIVSISPKRKTLEHVFMEEMKN